MPLGNGDIGVNAWVDPSGDLILYISKTDAWDEQMRLVKVGGMRLSFQPGLVRDGQAFHQTLDLATGQIGIRTPEQEINIWVDANHPVVQIEGYSLDGEAMSVTAVAHLWRVGQTVNPGYDNFPAFPRIAQPDTLLPLEEGQIGWYHHNTSSPWLENLKIQKLDGGELGRDPLLNRIFGAVVRGDNFESVSAGKLVMKAPAKSFALGVHVRTETDSNPAVWQKAVEAQAAATEATALDRRHEEHKAWWKAFWEKSWIYISEPSAPLPVSPRPWRVGMDSSGGSRFAGKISDACIEARALNSEEIADRAAKTRQGEEALSGGEVEIRHAVTLSAWIYPTRQERGRILDRMTVRGSDGILLDTHPGLALRLLVGKKSYATSVCLVPDEWQHVAATVDTETGCVRIYRNGAVVLGSNHVHDAGRVTQAYALQRFINACSGRGGYPIKFNGSIFTAEHGKHDADFRRWGGAYWFMNTRLIYWSMPMAGDLEMMKPLFKMYSDMIPIRKKATQIYFNHPGAYFPETTTIWGTFVDLNYGTRRTGKPDGLTDNQHIRYYWQGGIELLALMLDYHDYTQDSAFLNETLTPMAREVLAFFRNHWGKDAEGKIRFEPAQALECHFSAVNPAPEVAGLRSVLMRLLPLSLEPRLKEEWQAMLMELPDVPTQVDAEGNVSLLPGQSFSRKRQSEVPELYPVFPYRLYAWTAGEKALQIGRNTWKTSSKKNNGWGQTPIMAAMLGLADEAQRYVIGRVQAPAAGFRFPAFWGPNDDWMPDQDQCTIMMTALQRMLMQAEGDSIYLLPAWPKTWNASFKLHAPRNTVVEGRVEKGELVSWSVTPESRRGDVRILTGREGFRIPN